MRHHINRVTLIHTGLFISSYKFHRLFPLSQYDLPSHNSKILSFTQALQPDPSEAMIQHSTQPVPADENQGKPRDSISGADLPPKITQEQICQNNPDVDYTR